MDLKNLTSIIHRLFNHYNKILFFQSKEDEAYFTVKYLKSNLIFICSKCEILFTLKLAVCA